MAHVQKIKQGAVAPLVAHYERVAELERGFKRDNIDPARIADNYNLRPNDVRQEVRSAIAQHEETSGKGIRKDANVLCDWVVTMPKDCPRELHREFFEAVTRFMEGRYGEGNVLGCYVHMDETTPHAHIPILPMRDGKLLASKVVNRADLKSFHGDLGKAVDAALGMHVSVELSDEQNLNRVLLNADSQEQFQKAKDAARAEIDGEIQEAKRRLECLQREKERAEEEIRELEPLAHTVAESIGTLCGGVKALWTARSDGEREEVLAGEVGGLRSRISELEGANRAARERVEELDRGLSGLRGRHRELAERFGVLEQRVRKVFGRLCEVPNTLSEWAIGIAEEMGKRIFDPNSFESRARMAREAAMRAESRRRDDVSRGYRHAR